MSIIMNKQQRLAECLSIVCLTADTPSVGRHYMISEADLSRLQFLIEWLQRDLPAEPNIDTCCIHPGANFNMIGGK